MKVLFLTRHQWLGASSRYRSVQYFDGLTAMGHEIRQSYFFSDSYLRNRKNPARRLWHAMLGYARRTFGIAKSFQWADVIVIEKEVFPYFPYFLDSVIFKLGKPIVFDFDDAVWHADYPNPFSTWMKNKTAKLVSRADRVIAGSHSLHKQLDEWAPSRVHLIPTSIPQAKYTIDRRYTKTADIVWIGSPSTVKHLAMIAPCLSVLSRDFGYSVRVIGVPPDLRDYLPRNFDFIDWSSDTEIELIESARVGIMPLINDLFSQGKCAFKLIQYMGLGLPVVASPVGENEYVVEHASTGFLAYSHDDWIRYIKEILSDDELYKTMSKRGRQRYIERYTTEKNILHLERVLVDVYGLVRS